MSEGADADDADAARRLAHGATLPAAPLSGETQLTSPPLGSAAPLGAALDATLGADLGARAPASLPLAISPRLANAVFAAAVAIASAFLAYYAIRFLFAADPPDLARVFRGSLASDGTAGGAFASAREIDGPRLTVSRDLLIGLVYLGTALWLARGRGEPVSRLLGALGVLAGQYSTAVTVLTSSETLHPWRELAAVLYVVLPASLLAVLALYPNGRPVPRWSLRALPLAVAPFAAQAVVMYRTRGYSIAAAAAGLVAVGAFLAMQRHRYRRHATLREQRQIKWLSYAAAVFLAIQVVAVVGVLPLLADPTRAAFPVLKILYELLLAAAYLGALATMLFSAARYRLWDIDRVINRTIVYALVTALVFAAAALAFVALDGALRGATSASSPIAALASVALVAAGVAPARRRIARWIDRRFYGIGVDYEALAGAAMRANALALPTTERALGAYDDLVLLGRGGMGAVYLARHPEMPVPIALKVMSPQLAGDAAARARFRREADIVEQLRHAHVIAFVAAGDEHGLPFLAMHYVEGEDLGAILRARGALSLADVIAITTGVAAALDAAHRHGIVHRDVKPSNILVEGHARDPLATRRALLVDFGVAQLPEDAAQALEDGAIVGSLPYIAPEQIQRPNRVDGRADVYALGATIYEALTGTPPFRETSALGMVMAHLLQPPEDPRVHAPELPPAAAAAVLRALAKAPAERFATASELVAALRSR